jgi:hypothetical protein
VKEVKLPSGSTVSFNDPPAPWEESQALYEALLEEGKRVRVSDADEIFNVMKDVFCTAYASRSVKMAMKPLLARVLYNGAKITDATWEPVAAREDYYDLITEVAKENIAPFVKPLMQQFSPILAKIRSFLA